MDRNRIWMCPICKQEKLVYGKCYFKHLHDGEISDFVLKDNRLIKVFISGPYTAENKEDRDANIAKASEIAIEICLNGNNKYAPFTPHLNTQYFEEFYEDYDFYLNMCKEFLSVCDCILMMGDWLSSKGSIIEHNYAIENKISVFYSVEDLLRGN